MTTTPLPQLIEISSFTRGEQQLAGQLALADMPRLLEACAVASLSGSATLSLRGELTQGLKLLIGKINAVLPLVCQRCMQPLTESIASEFKLAVVSTEQDAEQLPADCEPLILPEGELELLTLVEDELLLAMPTVGLHPVEQCEIKQGSWHFGKPAVEEPKKANPFAQLAELKKDKD